MIMKIYFLRHEDRYPTIAFFSPLSIKGKQNAIKLVKDLERLKITKIFSSPFLRVLQTIEPYLNNNDIKVNLENSVRETNIIKGISELESRFELPEELYKQFKINEQYESFLKIEDVVYPEPVNNVKKRFFDFLKHLIETYHKTDENILIASHAGVIEQFIRKMQHKPGLTYLKKQPPFTYPLGKVTKIVEEKKLVFEKENY